VNGANGADCEMTWPVPILLCSASRILILGALRPLLLDGPWWSLLGHLYALVGIKKEQDCQLCERVAEEVNGETHKRRCPDNTDSRKLYFSFDASKWRAATGPDLSFSV
jgi:hypothetical protein